VELATLEHLDPTSVEDVIASLQQYRLTTLRAVESIFAWKQYISKLSPGPIKSQYIYDGRNYLIKMKTDTAFLQKSALCRVFEFTAKMDPLLVNPSVAYLKSAEIRETK
jgi:hypothetical protein